MRARGRSRAALSGARCSGDAGMRARRARPPRAHPPRSCRGRAARRLGRRRPAGGAEYARAASSPRPIRTAPSRAATRPARPRRSRHAAPNAHVSTRTATPTGPTSSRTTTRSRRRPRRSSAPRVRHRGRDLLALRARRAVTPLAPRARPRQDGSDDTFFGDMVVDLVPFAPAAHPERGAGGEDPSRARGGREHRYPPCASSTTARTTGSSSASRRRACGSSWSCRSRARPSAGDLADPAWSDLPKVAPLLPASRGGGARWRRTSAWSRTQSPRDVVAKLVAYFRSFTDSDDPPTGRDDVYLALALSKKGVCRHRAFAFLVTALGLGLPARMIANEAHAWVEVNDGATWRRIDLGGAGRALDAALAGSVKHDASCRSVRLAFERDARGRSRRSGARRRCASDTSTGGSRTEGAEHPAAPDATRRGLARATVGELGDGRRPARVAHHARLQRERRAPRRASARARRGHRRSATLAGTFLVEVWLRDADGAGSRSERWRPTTRGNSTGRWSCRHRRRWATTISTPGRRATRTAGPEVDHERGVRSVPLRSARAEAEDRRAGSDDARARAGHGPPRQLARRLLPCGPRALRSPRERPRRLRSGLLAPLPRHRARRLVAAGRARAVARRSQNRRDLTDEERAMLQSIDMEQLRRLFEERQREQKERHDGGNRWIGTGGSSPFGANGEHPSGVRVGPQGGGRSAMAVADARRYRPYRSDLVLDVRQMEVALRKLRAFHREGPSSSSTSKPPSTRPRRTRASWRSCSARRASRTCACFS